MLAIIICKIPTGEADKPVKENPNFKILLSNWHLLPLHKGGESQIVFSFSNNLQKRNQICPFSLQIKKIETVIWFFFWRQDKNENASEIYPTFARNIHQKLLFFHQLSHSMTTDCSLNYEFSTQKLQAQNMLCT